MGIVDPKPSQGIWVSSEKGTITTVQALNFFKRMAILGDLCGNETIQQICESSAVPFVFGKCVMMGEVVRIFVMVVKNISKRFMVHENNMAHIVRTLAGRIDEFCI